MASDNKVVSVLKEARRLIDEVGWTQREDARDSRGDPVSARNPQAVCFCAEGAIQRAGLGRYTGSARGAREVLRATLGMALIARFNDEPGRTKEEILAAFDRAIAAAQTEGRS